MTEIPDDFAFCKHGRFYGLCWECPEESWDAEADDQKDHEYEHDIARSIK